MGIMASPVKRYDFECDTSECPNRVEIITISLPSAIMKAEEMGWKVEPEDPGKKRQTVEDWVLRCPTCVKHPHWSEDEENGE